MKDRRLQEVASSLKLYYSQNGVTLPDCYNNIPDSYDETFDYKNLRNQFSEITFSKLPYENLMSGDEYRKLADITSRSTTAFLTEQNPNPHHVGKLKVNPV